MLTIPRPRASTPRIFPTLPLTLTCKKTFPGRGRLPFIKGPLGVLCPTCSQLLRFVNGEWLSMVAMLKRICAHRIAGKLQTVNDSEPRVAGFLGNLRPATTRDLESLGFRRSLAFRTDIRGNVFRLHNWTALCLFQRLIVHGFLTRKGEHINWRELDCWLAQTRAQDSVIPAVPNLVPNWYDAVMMIRDIDANSPRNNNVAVNNARQQTSAEIDAWLDNVYGPAQQ
ncbi:hypothetical protein SBRCBS47491_003246 [Sporothrix bragantina]|uniref:Uncharacterized protein n=1 Tax=Sporothrix bragantina TaxID=671064 RepID=A0ABP0BDN0_9PEZI